MQEANADSIVLEEEIDPNYVPSEEEVIEYAKWLGMDLDKDQDLYWIAREGLMAPLPKDWKPCRTKDTEDIYYFNFSTGDSTWDHPCDGYYKRLYEEEKKKKEIVIKESTDQNRSRAKSDVDKLLGKGEKKKKKPLTSGLILQDVKELQKPVLGALGHKQPLPDISQPPRSLNSNSLGSLSCLKVPIGNNNASSTLKDSKLNSSFDLNATSIKNIEHIAPSKETIVSSNTSSKLLSKFEQRYEIRPENFIVRTDVDTDSKPILSSNFGIDYHQESKYMDSLSDAKDSPSYTDDNHSTPFVAVRDGGSQHSSWASFEGTISVPENSSNQKSSRELIDSNQLHSKVNRSNDKIEKSQVDNANFDQLNQELEYYKKKCYDLNGRIDEYEVLLIKYKNSSQETNESKEAFERKYELNQIEWKDKLRKVEAEKDKVEYECRQVKSSLIDLELKYQSINTLKEDIKLAKSELIRSANTHHEVQCQLEEQFRNKIDSLKLQHQMELDEKQKIISSLQSSNYKLEQSKELLTEGSSSNEELRSLREQVNKNQQEHKILVRDLELSQEENRTLKSRYDDIYEKQRSYKTEENVLRNQIEINDSTIENLQKTITQLRSDITYKTEMIRQQQDQILQFPNLQYNAKKQMMGEDPDNNNSSTDHHSTHSDSDVYSSQLEMANKNFEIVRNSLCSELENLKERLQELEQEKNALFTQKSRQETELRHAKAELNQYATLGNSFRMLEKEKLDLVGQVEYLKIENDKLKANDREQQTLLLADNDRLHKEIDIERSRTEVKIKSYQEGTMQLQRSLNEVHASYKTQLDNQKNAFENEIQHRLDEKVASEKELQRRLDEKVASETELQRRLDEKVASETELYRRLDEKDASETELYRRLDEKVASETELQHKLDEKVASETELQRRLDDRLILDCKEIRHDFDDNITINIELQRRLEEKIIIEHDLRRRLEDKSISENEARRQLDIKVASERELQSKLDASAVLLTYVNNNEMQHLEEKVKNIGSLTKNIDDLKSQLDILTKHNDELKSTIEIKEQERQDILKSTSLKISQLESMNNHLLIVKQQSGGQNESNIENNESKTSTINKDLFQKKQALEYEKIELLKQINDLNHKLTAFQLRVDNMSTSILQLECERDTYKDKIIESEKMLVQSKLSERVFEMRADVLMNEISSLRRELDLNKLESNRYESITKENEEKTKMLDQYRIEIEVLKSAINTQSSLHPSTAMAIQSIPMPPSIETETHSTTTAVMVSAIASSVNTVPQQQIISNSVPQQQVISNSVPQQQIISTSVPQQQIIELSIAVNQQQMSMIRMEEYLVKTNKLIFDLQTTKTANTSNNNNDTNLDIVKEDNLVSKKAPVQSSIEEQYWSSNTEAVKSLMIPDVIKQRATYMEEESIYSSSDSSFAPIPMVRKSKEHDRRGGQYYKYAVSQKKTNSNIRDLALKDKKTVAKVFEATINTLNKDDIVTSSMFNSDTITKLIKKYNPISKPLTHTYKSREDGKFSSQSANLILLDVKARIRMEYKFIKELQSHCLNAKKNILHDQACIRNLKSLWKSQDSNSGTNVRGASSSRDDHIISTEAINAITIKANKAVDTLRETQEFIKVRERKLKSTKQSIEYFETLLINKSTDSSEHLEDLIRSISQRCAESAVDYDTLLSRSNIQKLDNDGVESYNSVLLEAGTEDLIDHISPTMQRSDIAAASNIIPPPPRSTADMFKIQTRINAIAERVISHPPPPPQPTQTHVLFSNHHNNYYGHQTTATSNSSTRGGGGGVLSLIRNTETRKRILQDQINKISERQNQSQKDCEKHYGWLDNLNKEVSYLPHSANSVRNINNIANYNLVKQKENNIGQSNANVDYFITTNNAIAYQDSTITHADSAALFSSRDNIHVPHLSINDI